VYFLELEANYLREQAKKATDMHPKMTAEAERMLYKLRVSLAPFEICFHCYYLSILNKK